VFVGETPHAGQRSRADLEASFATLLQAHERPLGRLAASYVRTPGEREDLLQDILLAIWRALPRFRGECSERTFVFRIAHNRAITYLSKRAPVTVGVDEEMDLADAMSNPENALAQNEHGRFLLEAIRRLPVGYAQVVTLTLEGLSYAETADVLGISETNVGARLTRARQMLRKRLGTTHGD
jgi:RNA polymerase sigma factor (sigma-70 family)